MRRRAALAALLIATAGSGSAQNPWRSGLLPAELTGVFETDSAALTERLREMYPPGSPAEGLRSAFLADGFEPEGDTAARRENRWGFPCRTGWLIRWTLDGSAIETIEGERYGICL